MSAFPFVSFFIFCPTFSLVLIPFHIFHFHFQFKHFFAVFQPNFGVLRIADRVNLLVVLGKMDCIPPAHREDRITIEYRQLEHWVPFDMVYFEDRALVHRKSLKVHYNQD